jgi:uncharacterized protein YeaO (DUF488 family)
MMHNRQRAMAIRVVRLGTPREPDEGVRIGTVRRPPRGVCKEDYSRRNFFDVWLPELAPTAPLVTYALSEPWTLGRWALYEKRYRREMSKPAAQRLIAMFAALSQQTNFSVGCYCENPHYCHRAILKELLAEAGAVIVQENALKT